MISGAAGTCFPAEAVWGEIRRCLAPGRTNKPLQTPSLRIETIKLRWDGSSPLPLLLEQGASFILPTNGRGFSCIPSPARPPVPIITSN